MRGQDHGGARGIGGNPSHAGVGFGQGVSERLPARAAIVAAVDAAAAGCPQPRGSGRIHAQCLGLRSRQAGTARLPVEAGIPARHHHPIDNCVKHFARLARHRQRSELGLTRQPVLDARPLVPAVVAAVQLAPADQIDPPRRCTERDGPRGRRFGRRRRLAPVASILAEHPARRRAKRRLAVRQEGDGEHAAEQLARLLRCPGTPAVAGPEQAGIGAQQQMRRVARIDGERDRPAQEQTHVGVEPARAEIARPEQPAVRAGIVRVRAATS